MGYSAKRPKELDMTDHTEHISFIRNTMRGFWVQWNEHKFCGQKT